MAQWQREMEFALTVNGEVRRFRGDGAMPLLWFVRDTLRLTGTKYGCGEGRCGACTLHVDGRAVRSCIVPMRQAAGRSVRTIEGLAAAEPPGAQGTGRSGRQGRTDGEGGASGAVAAGGASTSGLHPVQQAWLDEDVAQCGYCQAGQIMAAVDLLKRLPRPTDAEIDRHISNLCRCGTQMRVRQAIHRAAALMRGNRGVA